MLTSYRSKETISGGFQEIENLRVGIVGVAPKVVTAIQRLAKPGHMTEAANTMRTDLDHLPDKKRRDLQRMVEILFAEFAEAIGIATAKWKKQGRILKVVLYGSHARGDWVEDPVGGYFSDYDILVIVNDERLTDVVDYWAKADDHLTRAVTIDRTIGAPVNFIVHTLKDVNEQLQRGRPFFIDIIEQGIALYAAPDHPFDQPRPLTPEATLQEARANFEQWYPSAFEFFETARFAQSKGWNNKAAFDFHQSTERYLHSLLLSLTLYSPKSHKLNFLRSQAEAQAPELIEVWPRNTKFGQRCFELLRQAYVNARYSKHFKITAEELDWIAERIQLLAELVERICRERLGPT